MCLAVLKTAQQHLYRALIGHHAVADSMKDGSGAFDLLNRLEVVEALLQEEVDYATILLPCDLDDRLDRTDQNQRQTLCESTRQVASRPRADRPPTNNNLFLWNLACIP